MRSCARTSPGTADQFHYLHESTGNSSLSRRAAASDPPGCGEYALPPQQRDAAVEALEREREHARAEQFEHDLRGAGIAPRPLRLRIEPDRVAIGVDQAL